MHGITSYQVSSDFNRLVFPVAGSLYTMKVADIGMVQMKYSIRTGLYIVVDKAHRVCGIGKHEQ